MSINDKIIDQVRDDILIGLQNRITFLESLVERQTLNGFARDTEIIRKLILLSEALRVSAAGGAVESEIKKIKLDLEKILKNMTRKKRT
ncbi:MAG TPA: hypothetical protein VEP90_16625 [Methylomirabilota bacterium]|nr:hypothetical protein [Methylomirabilota bacterium]